VIEAQQRRRRAAPGASLAAWESGVPAHPVEGAVHDRLRRQPLWRGRARADRIGPPEKPKI